jgi:hypothetical protein
VSNWPRYYNIGHKTTSKILLPSQNPLVSIVCAPWILEEEEEEDAISMPKTKK